MHFCNDGFSFAYLRQFPAGENVQIADDIASRWHLLTTLTLFTNFSVANTFKPKAENPTFAERPVSEIEKLLENSFPNNSECATNQGRNCFNLC